MNEIKNTPIGIIHSQLNEPKGTPIQPSVAKGISGTVEVFTEYTLNEEHVSRMAICHFSEL